MKRIRKILVGVDLSWSDSFVSEELSAPNAEAVRQALRLAQLNSASIDFLFSLDLSAKAQQLMKSHVVVGKSWLELIRQVLRHQHDLVLVGINQTIGTLANMTFGVASCSPLQGGSPAAAVDYRKDAQCRIGIERRLRTR